MQKAFAVFRAEVHKKIAVIRSRRKTNPDGVKTGTHSGAMLGRKAVFDLPLCSISGDLSC